MIPALAWGIGCLACLLAASCEQADTASGTPVAGSSLQLGVVEKLTRTEDVNTRAAAGYEDMAEGDKLGLFRNGFRMVVFSVVIMIVVLFFRQGIMGNKEITDLLKPRKKTKEVAK